MENSGTADGAVELRRLHDGWIAANLMANVDWLRKNLHPEFAMFNNNGANYAGIENVASLWKSYQALAIKAAKAAKPGSKPALPKLDDFDVKIIEGSPLSIVTYQARFVIDFGDTDSVDETTRGTEVYSRTPDGWKMIHFHASPLKEVVVGGE